MRFYILTKFSVLLLLSLSTACFGDDPYEQLPVEYSRSKPDNCVSKLQASLDSGKEHLDFQAKLGYLPALLKALKVPVESQVLVFSQTSLQLHRISPRTPRAVYFSDDAYVGYCQAGSVLEVSAVDPQLGGVFYTLDQKKTDKPRLKRQTDNCLVCHSSSRTESVPGYLIRSLFVDRGGQPMLSEGSYTVDYRTPLEQRWGGWYVTGTHGSQTHLGNMVIENESVARPIANEKGQNVTSLANRFGVGEYLSPHSDIVALMVLEYQSLVENRITQANFTTRQALYYQESMDRALGGQGKQLESVTHRIQSAGDALIEGLLMVDEARLTAPIHGTSDFAEKFAQRGPRDRLGRSLRELDLNQRLFKYPFSYLVYSKAFAELPTEMREYVWERLRAILTGQAETEKFAYLSAADRKAIVEIIRDTVPNLPDGWKDFATDWSQSP